MNSISTLPESTVLLLLVLCIVFKDRAARVFAVLADSLFILPLLGPFVNGFFRKTYFLTFAVLTMSYCLAYQICPSVTISISPRVVKRMGSFQLLT